ATLGSRLGYYLIVWGRSEQADEGMTLLRAAVASSPDDPEVQANLGWAAHVRGDEADATTALEAALRLDPGRQLERYRLAIVLARPGDRGRARELIRAALGAGPGAPWGSGARETLRELEAAAAPRRG